MGGGESAGEFLSKGEKFNRCKKSKHFKHRENRANRDYKVKGSFPGATLSVCSVLIFFGCGLSTLGEYSHLLKLKNFGDIPILTANDLLIQIPK